MRLAPVGRAEVHSPDRVRVQPTMHPKGQQSEQRQGGGAKIHECQLLQAADGTTRTSLQYDGGEGRTTVQDLRRRVPLDRAELQAANAEVDATTGAAADAPS